MSKRAALLSYVVLVVLMTAGAAQSLSGSNTVDSGDIKDGQVTTADLAANAVIATRVKNESLTGTDIKNGTIGTLDLSDNAITSAKVTDNAITTGDILDGTVSYDDLAPNSVGSNNLKNGSVTGGKISSNVVYASASSSTVDAQGYVHGKCNPGDVPIGAAVVNDYNHDIDRSFGNGSDWLLGTNSTTAQPVYVSAICLDVTP